MQRRQHITHRRKCELHGALGAMSWIGVSQPEIAKHLRGDKGGTVSQSTVSRWYQCATPVPSEFHTPLWNLARVAVARTAELAERAVVLRPDLHRDREFTMNMRCIRRALEITFGFPYFREGDFPEPLIKKAEPEAAQ
jgi:hypothetical protein